MKFKLVELTKENEQNYLDQVAELEQVVLANMESKGQIGQLFPTGKQDISEYAHSKENTVLVAVDDLDKVLAATYITQGQKLFTYNDITKYFKYSQNYNDYVKGLYSSKEEYRRELIDTYEIKIEAFKHAKEKILEQFPEFNGDIIKFLQHELAEDGNHYHEKSQLRELVNRYMSEYIQQQAQSNPKLEQSYERFYWITAQEISKEFGTNVMPRQKQAREYESFINQEKEEAEYQQILKKGPLVIHETPNFDENKYFTATTSNSIELDTYLTDPNDRRAGLARILVLEGIKKHMEMHFNNPDNQEIFLCSTLHRDNLSSKYVSEFFGLTDSLYVKRRDGRDREVHICKVTKEQYPSYIEHMKKRIAVLYGYNPEKINISLQEQADIITEQLKYEETELKRLNLATSVKRKTYNGNIDYTKSKVNKIDGLRLILVDLQQQIAENKMKTAESNKSIETQKTVGNCQEKRGEEDR